MAVSCHKEHYVQGLIVSTALLSPLEVFVIIHPSFWIKKLKLEGFEWRFGIQTLIFRKPQSQCFCPSQSIIPSTEMSSRQVIYHSAIPLGLETLEYHSGVLAM